MIKQIFEELVASTKTFKEIEAEYGEEVAINVGIARDPDAPELDDEWFERARPATEVVPQVVERWRRTRGRQKAPTKEAISIRLDADVLAYYRATGRGWQGRINETLRKYTTGVGETQEAEQESEEGSDSG